ncbi:MAG: enoyl-CoA hydratase/isomerase family protein, partial [Pseudomonadales bacterium]|nr:enoyl-CoA hydratase/isomerase family protein [Pseudomonadales bacterium]
MNNIKLRLVMVFQGKTISVKVDGDIATMVFDAAAEAINKFDTATVDELRQSVTKLAALKDIKGLLICSGKTTFIVGADIKQFGQLFLNDEATIEQAVIDFNAVFSALEDLPFPTVSLIDGVALGGGLELCLATDFRVASYKAKVGLPEVKLGLNPGFGGTVRLPRIIGVDNAIEWIATGKEFKPQAALNVGLIDSLVDSELLFDAGLDLIAKANAGKFDIATIRHEKTSPVQLNDMERLMAFTTA